MLKQYFTFTKGERNAAVVLIAAIVALWVVPRLYFYLQPVPNAFLPTTDTSNVHAFIEAYNNQTADAPLFDFDPNQIGITEWQQLGFSEKQARAIEAYKIKRGGFEKATDLKEVYVISEEMYGRLLPYVRIERLQGDDAREGEPERMFVTVEINTADSAALVGLWGIGPYYARKILRYRNQLGGFVSVEQIKEVWGMPDSVYQKVKTQITCKPLVARKINVNKDDLEVMKAHPYIRTALGRILIKRRTKYGNFESVEDLRRIVQIDDNLYNKLLPYVTVK